MSGAWTLSPYVFRRPEIWIFKQNINDSISFRDVFQFCELFIEKELSHVSFEKGSLAVICHVLFNKWAWKDHGIHSSFHDCFVFRTASNSSVRLGNSASFGLFSRRGFGEKHSDFLRSIHRSISLFHMCKRCFKRPTHKRSIGPLYPWRAMEERFHPSRYLP